MAWPAALKAVLSIVSLLGKNKKSKDGKDGVGKFLAVSDLIGDLGGENNRTKRDDYESYAKNPTFKSFLSSESEYPRKPNPWDYEKRGGR